MKIVQVFMHKTCVIISLNSSPIYLISLLRLKVSPFTTMSNKIQIVGCTDSSNTDNSCIRQMDDQNKILLITVQIFCFNLNLYESIVLMKTHMY